MIARYWLAGLAIVVQAVALALGQTNKVINWPLVLLMCAAAGVTAAAVLRELADGGRQ